MSDPLCACGHPRHEGRCNEFEVVRPGKEQPCPCTAWTKPVENVKPRPLNCYCNELAPYAIPDAAVICGRCMDAGASPRTAQDVTRPVAGVEHDPVTSPAHYTWHPSGIEQIQVSEHMTFNLGAAVKYIWRAGRKGDAIQDLRKAAWHIAREIERLGVKP